MNYVPLPLLTAMAEEIVANLRVKRHREIPLVVVMKYKRPSIH